MVKKTDPNTNRTEHLAQERACHEKGEVTKHKYNSILSSSARSVRNQC
ncbi:hypothetical protein SynBIOSE41_02840 [Synechococcus sp. BIOS-E4-1]|nr:hypothetical protein SynBIOSE41_02840 [Synechococcus sp. BIOS-E4-1]